MGWDMPRKAESALARSHGVFGSLLGSVNGSEFSAPLSLAGKSTVAVDLKANTRRKLKATALSAIDSPLVSPLQAEVRAYYTIVDDPTGEEFAVPAGTFVVTAVEEASPGVVTVTGEDRWRRIMDARFPQPITTSGNTVAALRALITGADSRIEVVVDPGVNLGGTHRTSLWERDRDKAVVELARSIGAVVYFDPMGVAHIGPLPGLGRDPYWTIATGPGGARLGRRRGITRDRTYNAVAVVGDPGSSIPPVYGFAADLDPTSPTRYGGQFARKPRFYKSSLITTQAQADSTAASMLASVKGITHTQTVEALAHPGLDAGDVVRVEAGPGEWRPYLVGAFTLPLGLGAVSIDTLTTALADDESED